MPRLNLALLVALSSLPLFAGGCAATRNLDDTPAGSGPNKMLDDTAIGQNRCDEGKVTQQPFVVEWDATDLSTFEAKASRDLVFVKYQGCEMELMYGCSDNGIPGRYGTYADPTFTSGTVESFDMKNEDEVWAKLPLGAAQFGGKVTVGETLRLTYFVSGVVSSTRNYVEKSTLAGNPRCAEATHFVSAYNLGAFELGTYKGRKGDATVGVKDMGGGAKTTNESSNLKQGGSLTSCEEQSQRQCRVPIRLVLQPLDDNEVALDAPAPGAAPAAAAAIPATALTPPPQDSKFMKAYKLRQAAQEKERAGDGAGCLADLDRADKIDKSGGDRNRLAAQYIRAQCEMRAGKCDKGKATMSDYLKAVDEKHRQTDTQIAQAVNTFAMMKCPLSDQGTVAQKVTRIANEIGAAQQARSAPKCEAMAQEADKLFKGLSAAERKDVSTKSNVAGLMMRASACLVQMQQCDKAKTWWDRYYEAAFTGVISPQELESAREQVWATMKCGQ